jgi:hypothetical protein
MGLLGDFSTNDWTNKRQRVVCAPSYGGVSIDATQATRLTAVHLCAHYHTHTQTQSGLDQLYAPIEIISMRPVLFTIGQLDRQPIVCPE